MTNIISELPVFGSHVELLRELDRFEVDVAETQPLSHLREEVFRGDDQLRKGPVEPEHEKAEIMIGMGFPAPGRIMVIEKKDLPPLVYPIEDVEGIAAVSLA
jgi:hypothetical protein